MGEFRFAIRALRSTPGPAAAAIATLGVACREVVGVAHDMRQRSLVPTGDEDRLMQ